MKTLNVIHLLEAKEGENVEFKSARNHYEFDNLVKYACAIANHGGGMVVLGITDKRPRQVLGTRAFDQPERTRKGLADRLGLRVDFDLLEHEGKRVLVFRIPSRPVGVPVHADGIVWWRDGDSLVKMPMDVMRGIFAESGHDFSADVCTGLEIGDLDPAAIELFRRRWVEKSGRAELATLSHEQLLTDCEALTRKGLTYAALILFGTREAMGRLLAQAEVIFEYRSVEAAGPAQQREEFRQGVFLSLDRLWELINLRNDKQHFQDGLFVMDVPTFDERAVREAVLNAVSHRDYQLGGSVFVRQFTHRLEIDSPGGFPPGITPENVLDRQLPRNRRMADIFSKCGLVERAGQGMNLMFEQSIRQAKALPDFRGTDDMHVRVTLEGIVQDKNLLVMMEKVGRETLETFSTADFLVVNALRLGHPIPESCKDRVPRLLDLGVIERASRGRYLLGRRYHRDAGKKGTYTRKKGLDRETNKELLLKHIRENEAEGSKMGEFRQVLPALTRGQVQTLLRELAKDDKVHVVGTTSAARWYPGVAS